MESRIVVVGLDLESETAAFWTSEDGKVGQGRRMMMLCSRFAQSPIPGHAPIGPEAGTN